MTTIESLPNDLYRKLALDLSLADIERLCLTSKRLKKEICDSKDFWRLKIRNDFPLRGKYIPKVLVTLYQNDPRKLYHRFQQKAKKFTFYHGRDILRGDVISDKGYEKIWDGEKIIPVIPIVSQGISGFDILIPESIRFPEFPINHFSKAIYSSYNIHLSPEKIQELINNFDEERQTSAITDKYNTYKLKIQTSIYDEQEDSHVFLNITHVLLKNSLSKGYVMYNEEDIDDKGDLVYVINLDVENKND